MLKLLGPPSLSQLRYSEKLAKTDENPMFGQNHTPDSLMKISLAKSKKVFIYTKDSILNEIILFKSFDNYKTDPRSQVFNFLY